MKVSVTGDVPATPELSQLERAVLAVALNGSDAAALRAQAERAQVVSRTYSGVGFLTRFRVPDAAPTAAAGAHVPPVAGAHPAVPGGAEFLVEIRNGRLHSVEAFCFDGMWPADENGFELACAEPTGR